MRQGMRGLTRLPAALGALLLLCLAGRCQARITEAGVLKDDRQIILIASPFGFSLGGHLDILLRDFKHFPEGQRKAEIDFSKLGFFITESQAEAQLELDLAQDTCGLEAANVVTLFTFDQVMRDTVAGMDSQFNGSLAELVPNYHGGEYSLFFANCERLLMVSYDIQVSLYNVDAKGNKDYLSVGEHMLPTVYMVMFVLFAVAGALWGLLVVRTRVHMHRIHSLMGVLAAAKALTLLSQAGMYHLIRQTGHPDGWNFAFYIFTFLRGILFFTVVVLVGTGWSYMKPLLANKEKQILMVVIPLQVCAEVAIVIMDTNTPASRSWFTWRDVLHLVDIICCCAILFPIVWSIKHLREASQTDGKAARNLVKLQLFQQFYVLVVSYVYFTRIVVYLLKWTVSYEYAWLSEAAGELGTLAFYVLVGIRFRPKAENPYFQITQEDKEGLVQDVL